jgi:hypothetical protein
MDAELTLPPRLLELALDLPLEELAFHAVPVRARHDGWTPQRQRAFILRLALTGSVGGALIVGAGLSGRPRRPVIGAIHRHDNRLAMSVLNAMDRLARRPLAPAIERRLDALFDPGPPSGTRGGPH